MTESIYLALDFPSWELTESFLIRNDLQGIPVKIGMELYYREGPSIIEKLRKNNHTIFLDLKLHDIPTTVMRAMKILSSLEVDMVNVHALGGSEMIHYAKEGLISGNSTNHPKLIAVTVVTSMDNRQLNKELLIPGDLTNMTIHLAGLAKENGADGVVCSVHEAKQIKEDCGDLFLTVTPGIRLHQTNTDDQKRIATPIYARENGADYLVIGRSVTNAKNPRLAYDQAVKEWGK
ncbi:orotidine-5'-phosphate decarboxylase [Ornithinibacillus bavariensis]|uniref:Orotidine 5'-phosphate decarboxylase n=1 Tax=Ornithinibacillus bavariensis TaxID=545502 RepID=A0A919X8G1_9BACI|nr:orotidine-5'-phosphate decarboxylase [Ornithinibacillus bavariensis]GIO26090.1 orotidine 5'-phosphate decarboxylase [Ornithinibacillus bavariensis]